MSAMHSHCTQVVAQSASRIMEQLCRITTCMRCWTGLSSLCALSEPQLRAFVPRGGGGGRLQPVLTRPTPQLSVENSGGVLVGGGGRGGYWREGGGGGGLAKPRMVLPITPPGPLSSNTRGGGGWEGGSHARTGPDRPLPPPQHMPPALRNRLATGAALSLCRGAHLLGPPDAMHRDVV